MRHGRLLLAAALLAALVAPALAQTGQADRILVLYKQREPKHREALDLVTRHLEKAGYRWEARDVEALLAQGLDMAPYRGIATCYTTGKMVGADRYPGWLVEQMEAGRKVAIVGTYGAFQNLVPRPDGRVLELNESPLTINTFFRPFGLEFYFAFSGDASRLEVLHKEPRYTEFQAPLDPAHVTYYQMFRSVHPENRSYLTVRRTDMVDSESAFVVHTPFGGMILDGYVEVEDWKTRKKLLRVDLAGFLSGCFEGQAPPVPTYDLTSHEDLVASRPLPEAAPPTPSERPAAGEERRRVLVVYKRSENPKRDDHPIFNRAEIVLNYLGLAVDYRAVEDGLLSEAEMDPYRGIVTWHTGDRMPDATGYGEWLAGQVERGRRVVILGRYGASLDATTSTASRSADAVFTRLGMARSRLATSRFERHPEVVVQDTTMGFERQVDVRDLAYEQRTLSTSPANRVHFAVNDPYSGRVDLVVTGPTGGVALAEAGFFFPRGDRPRVHRVYEALAGKLQPEVALEKTLGAWLVDPVVFFTESLGLASMPAPDYTTMNGRRLFFAHIDGDGLESVSLIDRARPAGSYILKEILEPYPQVPTSVSVITEPMERNGNRYFHPTVELARQIFRLPYVEVATHTATHPFDWVKGDPVVQEASGGTVPMDIGHRPPDLVREIWGSRLFIETNLAPPEKPVQVLFWSGATNPDGRALEVAHRAGLLNLNGGDPIFDSERPSVAGLTPLTMQYGPFRQLLGVARNDYVYTLFLTGDKGGQKDVIDHFEHTEKPRRLLPMNLYYHFYSGIYQESLDALKAVLDYAVAQEPAMIFASDYCRIVEDFDRTRIRRDGTAWVVSNAGNLREVRLPGTVAVDVAASTGVAGYSHHQGWTYVHLDGRPERRIVPGAGTARVPFVQECTYFIDRAEPRPDGLELELRGFGKLSLSLGGLGAGPWNVAIVRADELPAFAPEGAEPAGTALARTLSAGSADEARISLDLPAPPASYRLTVTR